MAEIKSQRPKGYTISEKGTDLTMFRLSEDRVDRILSYTGGVASAAFFLFAGVAINTYQQLHGNLDTNQRFQLEIELKYALITTGVLFFFSLQNWYEKFKIKFHIKVGKTPTQWCWDYYNRGASHEE